MGVNVFVLISGYFLIESKTQSFDFNRSFRFWGQLFFYSLLIFGFSFVTKNGHTGISDIVKTFFPVTFSVWWFASTYFVLYLLHPYLNKFLRSITKKEYQAFLGLLIIIWCVIPTLTTSNYQANSLWEFVMFYAIAGYIRLYGLNPKLKGWYYFIGFAGFMLLTFASYVICTVAATKIPVVASRALHFYGRNKIPTLLASVCLFAAFTNIKPFYSRFINIVSSATFGVYLLHDHPVLREYLWIDLFNNSAFSDTIMIIPYSIFTTMLIYICATLIDLLRQQIAKPVSKTFNRLTAAKSKENKLLSKVGYIIFGKD